MTSRRFFASRRQCTPAVGDEPVLGNGAMGQCGNGEGAAPALPPASLLTVACPLRQLHAARFPGL